MNHDFANPTDTTTAAVRMGIKPDDSARAGGTFTLTCFDKDGNQKWVADKHNLVVNVGLKDMNDKYFSGSAYTATWYLGLYGAAASNNPAAGDTSASHAGWTEIVDYSQSTRPQAVFAAATTADPSVSSNSASPATFSINGTTTIGGAFLISDSTKGGTTGILFSAGDFGAPGDRSCVSGDTIVATYTFSLGAI